jgi:Ca2+-binding EF-hand superfamily protein
LGLSSTDLFSKIDLNGTSSIEKQEFLTFFTSTLALKGLTQDDQELLFDALDTNRD